MNTTMKWLLKRELWEHKGGFVWTPAIVGAIIGMARRLIWSGGAG